jgi:erythromycin esterase
MMPLIRTTVHPAPGNPTTRGPLATAAGIQGHPVPIGVCPFQAGKGRNEARAALEVHHGPASKGLMWERNNHIGDARATSMAAGGLVNVGQLIRERHGAEEVVFIGCAAHRATVIAIQACGNPEKSMAVPEPRLSRRAEHRTIGWCAALWQEASNYVPTVMDERQNLLLWVEGATALRPLHHEQSPEEPPYETEPSYS